MEQSELQSIETLFSDFAYYADHGNAEALAQLFVQDGVLSIGDRQSVGRIAITADCQKRFDVPNRKTRHAWSNLRVTDLTSVRASTTAIQLTFETSGSDTSTRLRVNDVLDVLQRDSRGIWQFVNREIRCEIALYL